MNNPASLSRMVERAIKNKKISSEKELNSFLRELFTQHNLKMDRVNKELGAGLGVFIARADKLIQQKRSPEAIKVCNKILNAYPECDEALVMKIVACISVGDYGTADTCFEKCKETDPDNPEIYVLKWQLELEKIIKRDKINAEDLQKTLVFLETALKINSQYFDALISKAQILFWLGDDKYQKVLHKCQRIDALRTKNFLKKHWIEEIPDCHPLAVISDSISKIENLMRKNDYQQALTEINKIIDKDMEQGLKEVLHSLKIENLICLKEYPQAEAAISDLISLNKDYPLPYFHQAIIYSKCSEFDKTLEPINQCIAVAEKVSMKHPQYYQFKADILKKLGREGWQEFERKAKEVSAENNQLFNRLCKEKRLNPQDFL